MLSDSTIRVLLANGTIGIVPTPADVAFQPASVDLCLDDTFLVGTRRTQVSGESFQLGAGVCALASTVETVTLPASVVGRVEGKSTWGRRFLMVHSTAGFIDPGFSGQITLELCNLTRRPLLLYPGRAIAQISFDWLDVPARRPYGHPELRSHYQHQRGVTPPHS